jgi:hypothetical protein
MFSRDQLKRAATLTEEDFVQLDKCRRPHNRLGFAYQVAFVRPFVRYRLSSIRILRALEISSVAMIDQELTLRHERV